MFSLYCTDFPIAKITYLAPICMRIFRNVTQLETVMKEKLHWAFAMYGCLDKVIGLLYLCPSLSPCTLCVSCIVKNWGFFGQ